MTTDIAELSAQIDSPIIPVVATTADLSARIGVLQSAKIDIKLLGLTADLSNFENAWRNLLIPTNTLNAQQRAGSDWQLADLLHEALRHLPRRILLKPRFWEWLSLVKLPDYVIARWVSDLSNFTQANCGRFLCSSGVAGIETNALARLYWTADVSWSARGDYTGVDHLFRNQDLHKTIFTNELCLQQRLCLAHADEMSQNFDEDEAREMVKILGKIQASTSYVSMTDQDLRSLVQAIRPLIPKNA